MEQSAPSTTDAEIARKNMVWGWGLFGLFCVLFAGTVGVAYVYLWLS
ncbi:MAG TPA: hypothetical protein VGU02_01190 [Gaiellaceae bacterium]|nr:hypothetical protein [Gaiellaceae bacterium]